MDDRQAIVKLKAGDIDGLEPLVHHYQAQALHIAYLITRDAALAEDIVQNAFVRAFERIRQFDAARPFSPWFFRIVSNEAVRTAQRQTRLVSLDDGLEGRFDDKSGLPEHQLEKAQTREQLWELLRQLSPKQRAVVVLRFYAGFAYDEIAHELSVPPPTVRWRLHAALRQLRSLLG